jgi:hypothetical protein
MTSVDFSWVRFGMVPEVRTPKPEVRYATDEDAASEPTTQRGSVKTPVARC